MPQSIQTAALTEIYKSNINGCIPVLIDVQNDKIKWDSTDSQQMAGHFRLVSDVKGVVYKGNYYHPSALTYTPPAIDGKTVTGASVKISCLDRRAVELIRSIKEPLYVEIIAAFMKHGDDIAFYPLSNMKSWILSSSWSGLTASFPLTFDRTMDLEVPRDTATLQRCPSINTEE